MFFFLLNISSVFSTCRPGRASRAPQPPPPRGRPRARPQPQERQVQDQLQEAWPQAQGRGRQDLQRQGLPQGGQGQYFFKIKD